MGVTIIIDAATRPTGWSWRGLRGDFIGIFYWGIFLFFAHLLGFSVWKRCLFWHFGFDSNHLPKRRKFLAPCPWKVFCLRFCDLIGWSSKRVKIMHCSRNGHTSSLLGLFSGGFQLHRRLPSWTKTMAPRFFLGFYHPWNVYYFFATRWKENNKETRKCTDGL